MTTQRPTSDISRRAVLRTTAWSVPVVAVAAVAPAFAASEAVWTITSESWEGGVGGGRSNNARYHFRFTITAPTGTTITGPSATFTAGGNGCMISGVNPTGTVDGWGATGSDNVGASAGAYRTFAFTHGDIVGGGAAVTLNFTMEDVADSDIGAGGRSFTFTSGSPGTGPSTTFTVLQANVANYITNPHV